MKKWGKNLCSLPVHTSTNINEVIKTVLNFLLYFTRTKKHQEAPKSTKSIKSTKT